jgi:hypothetical protein
MIFDTELWRLVRMNYPLLQREVTQFEIMIEDSAKVAMGLVMWGLTLQERSSDSSLLEAFGSDPLDQICPGTCAETVRYCKCPKLFTPSMGW